MSEKKLLKLRRNARSAQATFDAALQSALDPTLNDNPTNFANGRINLAKAKTNLTKANAEFDGYRAREHGNR